jgi:hypothetical protein
MEEDIANLRENLAAAGSNLTWQLKRASSNRSVSAASTKIRTKQKGQSVLGR